MSGASTGYSNVSGDGSKGSENGHHRLTKREAASLYQSEGLRVVVVRAKAKKPILDDWPNLIHTDEELDRYLLAGANELGVQTGVPSGNVLVMDYDQPEAQRAARYFFPLTARRHGRASDPSSHEWYRIVSNVEALSYHKFEFPFGPGHERERDSLVERFWTGHQVVVPPSRHPKDPRGYVFAEHGDMTEMDGRVAVRASELTAACALFAMYWPAEGKRDDAALALHGLLLRHGWSQEKTSQFVYAVASVAGDPEAKKRSEAGKAERTGQRLRDREHVTGGKALGRLLGPDGAEVVKTACEWLHLPQIAEREHSERVGVVGMTSVRASEVVEKPLLWLWPRYIPLGKATLLDGEPDKGKSQVTIDLTARLTTGRPMPDDSHHQVANGGPVDVIIMSCEDDPEDTIVPRLRLAGADLSRVTLILNVELSDGSTALPSIPRDLPLLRQKILETGAKAVFIDPLVGYLDSKVDSHNDANVRQALNAVHAIARETGVAMVGIRHFTKDSRETNPLARGGGSVGIIGFARSALAIVQDPNPDNPQRRYLGPTKNNLTQSGAPTLAYEIVGVETTVAGVPVSLSRVEWAGSDSRNIRQLLVEVNAQASRDPEQDTQLDRCFSALSELLGDNQEHKATDIENALYQRDISDATSKKAQAIWLKRGWLVKRKRGGQGRGTNRQPFYWTWRLVPLLERGGLD